MGLLGSSVAPGANPLAPQLFKLHKKLEAGARFLISQPVSSLEEWKGFADQAKTGEAKIIAGE